MKKYLLVFVLVLGFAFWGGTRANAACSTFACGGQGDLNSGTSSNQMGDGTCCHGTNADGNSCTVKPGPQITYYDPQTGNIIGSYSPSVCATYKSTPFPITEPIASPVPPISNSQPNQYIFKPYPFQSVPGQGNQVPIPVNDPMINGSFPTDPNDTPVDIDSTGLVPSMFNLSNATVFWPPTSIWTFMGLNPIADTFKAFTNTTWNLDSAIHSKGYPLNYFSLGNPAPLSPLIPVTIKWDAIPGAVSYHFTLSVAGNPFSLDDNLPTPIDIPNTTSRTYSFIGRGNVSYSWRATPLDASGNVILGLPFISYGGTGYTNNPYWRNTASQTDSYCGIVAGHTYFTDRRNLVFGDCSPENTFPYNGTNTGGWRHGYEFIEWWPITNAVKYEIQYSFKPIPEGTPFTDGATFSNTYTTLAGNQTTQTFTSHVINLTNCPGCGLHSSDDLLPTRPGFQFNFNSVNPIPQGQVGGTGPGVNPDGTPAGIYWRVQGVDVNGNYIGKDISVGSIIEPPLPKTPFQSGYPFWNKVTGATGYVVDVVQDIDSNTLENSSTTFGLFPNLDVSTVSNNSQRVDITPTITTNAFMLRRVVSDGIYNVPKAAVDHFKPLLEKSRISFIEEATSAGIYDGLYADMPYEEYGIDWIKIDRNNLDAFNSNYDPIQLDNFYPKMTDDLGMTITSPTPNSIKIVTDKKIIIKNKSTGSGKIVITQSSDKKTTTLTFSVNGTGAGTYGFEIVKIVDICTSNCLGVISVFHPITYETFGPMPVIANGNLNGKVFTEFNKLLPGTTYKYRTRCFIDPNPEELNIGANRITFCPSWSAVQTFTTDTGVPASITIQPTTVTSNKANSKSLKSSPSKNVFFDAIESKNNLKGTIKPVNLSKITKDKNKTSEIKISNDQIKSSITLRNNLLKAYKDLLNARDSKNINEIKSAESELKSIAGSMRQKSISKKDLTATIENSEIDISTVISVVVLLGLGGFMIFRYMKNRKQSSEIVE